MPSTGYLIDHPLTIAHDHSPRNWPVSTLLAAAPVSALGPLYLDSDIAPNALDQDGVGACTQFAISQIMQAIAHKQTGKWPFTTTSAFLAWKWQKNGSPDGSYPGDGAPGVDGSYCSAALELARKYGIPDGAGNLHKITGWYSSPLATQADLDLLRQTIAGHYPVNVATPWPGNWFGHPAAPDYLMPGAGGAVSAHSYALAGWKQLAAMDGTFLNSWGYWGSAQGLFRYPLDDLIGSPFGPNMFFVPVVTIDPPKPPTPGPEGPMLAITDKVSRLVDSTIGAQVYKLDGTTPLVKIRSGPTNLASPCALAGGFYAVLVSIGGILQLGAVKTVTNVRIQGDSSLAVAAEHKRWTDWLTTQPK